MEAAGPGPTEAAGPGPTETAGPGPTYTAGPGPTEAAGPGPAETAGPGPTDEAGPGPTETAGPADEGSRTGTGSCCSLSRCVCVYVCMCEVYQHLLTALHEFNSVGVKSCWSVIDLGDAIGQMM